MNIRRLLPFALLSSVLVLSACGNKGPLMLPPAPDDQEWRSDPAGTDGSDADEGIDAGVEDGVDGEGEDPEPADAGEDGDGGA